jgi:hypothetical protein
MIRLNGWHRIGIVLSIIWLPIGFVWGNRVGIAEGDWVSQNYALCLIDATPQQNKVCNATYYHDWPIAIQYHWWYAGFYALLPILLVWPSIYFVRFIVRWIARGFKPETMRQSDVEINCLAHSFSHPRRHSQSSRSPSLRRQC